MSKKNKVTPVILLAYFHRYGWLVLTMVLYGLTRKEMILGISMLVYAAWYFLGYVFHWKHFYCSYQNLYHKPMTPDRIDWSTVKKTDAYGVPILFAILGLAMVCLELFRFFGIDGF